MYGSRPVIAKVPTRRRESMLLTVEEAAALLHIGRSRVYDLIARGEIESLKIGWSRRVRRDAVKAYIRQLATEQDAGDAA
jgi:excisionase family DNA binding protein